MARQPTRTQIAAIEELVSTWEARIRDAFMAAVYRLRGQIDLARVEELYQRGDIPALLDLLRMDESNLWELREAVRGTVLAGGAAVAEAAPAGLEGRFGFNGYHPRATELIRRIGGDLVTNLESNEREAIRLTLTDAIQRNRSSREVALDLVGRKSRITGQREGGIIGLSGPQTERYLTVQRLMMTPEGVADLVIQKDGKLTVRYKVNPATAARIIRAYKRGDAVSVADRELSERQYKNKLLEERGRLIAANEAHTAQAAGRYEAYEQVLNRPDVERIEKTWRHGHSREPRPDHRRLDGTKIDFRAKFQMDDGTMMAHPHDPAGGAKHSLGCKCDLFCRIVLQRD